MMDESHGEDPAMSYQPMPALGEMQGGAKGQEEPPSYADGASGAAPSTAYAASEPAPAARQLPVNIDTIRSPVFIVSLMTWHFFWTTWSNMSTISGNSLGNPWISPGWYIYAMSLIVVGLWTAADQRPISALVMVQFFALSILCDYIFLGIYMPHALDTVTSQSTTVHRNIRRFSFAAAIINHLTKYLTTAIALLTFKARGGGASFMTGSRAYNELE